MPQETADPLSDSVCTLLANLASLIGEAGFGDALVSLLRNIADIDHVIVFSLDHDRPIPILAASQDAPTLLEMASRRFVEDYSLIDPLLPPVRASADSTTPRLFRANVQSMPHRELFELLEGPLSISERLVVAGRAAQVKMAASLVRLARAGRLDDATADSLLRWFPVVLALIASHSRLTGRLADSSRAFGSVSVIEQSLAARTSNLSARQRQVCARILFGMSTEGISIDLNIGGETVVTHRKQAYQRLMIANQFELTRWYLGLLSV